MKKCSWKIIVDMLSNPEGQLKVCYHKCDGYNKSCPAYETECETLVKDGRPKIKTGIERFFSRYPNYKNMEN